MNTIIGMLNELIFSWKNKTNGINMKHSLMFFKILRKIASLLECFEIEARSMKLVCSWHIIQDTFHLVWKCLDTNLMTIIAVSGLPEYYLIT